MFELPKNKMEEEVGGAWKGRTVFSHFRHPLKGFARRVGRALTLLIRLSQSCMDTLEMDKIEGVKEWVDKTNERLGCMGGGVEPPGRRPDPTPPPPPPPPPPPLPPPPLPTAGGNQQISGA